jgi:hypothetical protein
MENGFFFNKVFGNILFLNMEFWQLIKYSKDICWAALVVTMLLSKRLMGPFESFEVWTCLLLLPWQRVKDNINHNQRVENIVYCEPHQSPWHTQVLVNENILMANQGLKNTLLIKDH